MFSCSCNSSYYSYSSYRYYYSSYYCCYYSSVSVSRPADAAAVLDWYSVSARHFLLLFVFYDELVRSGSLLVTLQSRLTHSCLVFLFSVCSLSFSSIGLHMVSLRVLNSCDNKKEKGEDKKSCAIKILQYYLCVKIHQTLWNFPHSCFFH